MRPALKIPQGWR